MGSASADVERTLNKIARLQDPLCINRSHHHVDRVLLEAFQFAELRHWNQLAVDKKSVEPLAFRPARNVGVKSFPRLDQRGEHLEWSAFHRDLELPDNGRQTLFLDGQVAIGTELGPGLRK